MKKVLVVALVLALSSMVSAAMAFEFTDNFSYANGSLYGNGTWVKGGSTSWISVEDGAVRINGGDTATGRNVGTLAAAGQTGTIYIDLDIKGDGVGGSTSWGFNIDDINQADPAGGTICRWYGTTNTARGRNDWVGVTPVQTLTGTPAWDHLSLVINTATATADFSANGVLLGTVNYGAKTPAGTAIGRISFYQISNASGSGSIYFDNLRVADSAMVVTPEPGSILALCSGLIGIVGFARRRRA